MKKSIEAKRGDFLLYLEEIRGYSDLTIKSYDESLKEAFAYIEVLQEGGHTLLNLMPYRIKISSLNPKTISKKLSAIRSFAEYLNDNGIRVVLKADESVKVAKTLPKPISHKHIVEAISHCDLREKLVVTLLYTLGLRISELASLKLENVSEKWIRVIGKGNKQRDIPL
ncbi:MAG: tyrosine-type recombinase/integrase, partial [Sulfurimonas sp.]